MKFSLPPNSFFRRGAVLGMVLALGACASHVTPPTTTAPAPVLSHNEKQCLAELDRLGVRYQSEPMGASAGPGCLVQNPVRVIAATVPFNRSAVAACQFVIKFDNFEQQVIRPLAKKYFGQDVKQIVHFGIYNCRATKAGRESEHARGLAMDLAGFELTDGTMISVKHDWGKRGKARDFLHAVAAQACHYFNEVLDPDSDRDHLDHMHLDLGRYKLCVRR